MKYPHFKECLLFAAVLIPISGAFMLLRKLERGAGGHFHYFLLGLSFTLTESASIVRPSLLFGSTWIANVNGVCRATGTACRSH